MKTTGWTIYGIAMVAIVTLPEPLYACSVCFSMVPQERWAFYLTTIALIILPMAMLGAFFYWLRRSFHQSFPSDSGD